MKLTPEEKEEVRETYLKILEILFAKNPMIVHQVLSRLMVDIFNSKEGDNEKNAD